LKLKNIGVRGGLAVLLVVLAAIPIAYPYLASLLSPLPAFREATDFVVAPDVPVSPIELLYYAGYAMDSAQVGNYTHALEVLNLMNELPANIEHNLQTYLSLVNELIATLNSAKLGLGQLQNMTQDGAVASARQKIIELKALLANAESTLQLLLSSLSQIQAIYSIDVSSQRTKLEALAIILQGFEQDLARLITIVEDLDRRKPTQLTLIVFPKSLMVDGNVTLYGNLKSQGIALPGRDIEVWINEIQVFKSTTSGGGNFTFQYAIAADSHPDSLVAYIRYIPAGNDAAKLRPSKSATITIPVHYHAASLSAYSSSRSVHVLGSFTVQGKLVTASKTPLAGRTIQLVIDGAPSGVNLTDDNGRYVIRTAFPIGTAAGRHTIYLSFDPTTGIYASATSNRLQLDVYYLNSTITLAENGSSGFSGQTILVAGEITSASNAPSNGVVIAYLGAGRELSRTTVGVNGTFNLALSIPLESSGNSVIQLLFMSATPWVENSSSQLLLNVWNIPSVALTVAALAFLGTVLLSKSDSILPHRRRNGKVVYPELVRPILPEPNQRPAIRPTLNLRKLKQIDDPQRCIIETYWALRTVVDQALASQRVTSETHREYQTRITASLTDEANTPFASLTDLFEFAEYSQRTLSRTQSEEGINHAILVAEAQNVEVKS
jgi:hypothetical protein